MVHTKEEDYHWWENNGLDLQEVFLTIRRHKTTIFTDLKESNTIQELKKVIQGILKIAPEDQVLYDGTTDQVCLYYCH